MQPSNVRDQLNKATVPPQSQPSGSKPSVTVPMQAPKPAPVPKPAAPVKTPAAAAKGSTPAKAKAPASANAAAATAESKKTEKTKTDQSAKPPAGKPSEEKAAAVAHRDPFEGLLYKARAGTGTPENLPPGKPGLVVGTLRIDGIVNASGGMIAIVSNPQQRVYFLREGDKLYDGSVEHITLEAISFREIGKDAFGNPLERQVTKRLYPSPGESQ